MACRQFREDLQSYLDGELAPPRRAALEAHLRECADCRRVLDELQAVSGVLAHWPDRVPSDKLAFTIQFKLSSESSPAEKAGAAKQQVPPAAASRPVKARRDPMPWFWRGWRPALAVALVLTAFVVVVALQGRGKRRQRIRIKPAVDAVGAFAAAGAYEGAPDACAYVATVAKRAVQEETLDVEMVASSDVLYAFLGSAKSQADKRAGLRLLDLLARRSRAPQRSAKPVVASLLGIFDGFFVRDLYAAGLPVDVLAEARRYEMQGRLNEALLRYAAVSTGKDAKRARLAEGALQLRMGDLEAAAVNLEDAAADSNAAVRSSAEILLEEIATAHKGRAVLSRLRATAKTGADWYKVGLYEVRAYDFRDAANSFMKAAAAGDEDARLRDEARFRSAWCQKEIGQISTAVYGFRTVVGDSKEPGELEYGAGIEQAVALARIGRFDESVAVCRDLVNRQGPSRNLEALAYFQEGSVELRYLDDRNAAAESLGRVASGGRGTLSNAAHILLQSRSH